MIPSDPCGEGFSRRRIIFDREGAPTLLEVLVQRNVPVWILFLCLFVCRSFAQSPPGQNPPSPSRPNLSLPGTDEEEARDRLTRDMAKKAAKERAAALKADTDKLLKLSVELKQYVDKSDENVLSLDVIKKAEEIEKLAKSVKEKMKGPN